MDTDYSEADRELVAQIARAHGEQKQKYGIYEVGRNELVRAIHDHPDIDANEPEEILEAIEYAIHWSLLWRTGELYGVMPSEEDEREKRCSEIQSIADALEE
ncbi:MAG: hypothetical protein IH933_05170 [Euryarchaeota archaeon]|nr:hypothetical protein [Euryarchaeota archaeon]